MYVYGRCVWLKADSHIGIVRSYDCGLKVPCRWTSGSPRRDHVYFLPQIRLTFIGLWRLDVWIKTYIYTDRQTDRRMYAHIQTRTRRITVRLWKFLKRIELNCALVRNNTCELPSILAALKVKGQRSRSRSTRLSFNRRQTIREEDTNPRFSLRRLVCDFMSATPDTHHRLPLWAR